MADDRLRAWEKLFSHALSILDESVATGAPESGWSFGGGTVLMRRYRHRVSRDVDIWKGWPPEASIVERESTKLVPAEDRKRFVEMAIEELNGLHEGNIARYRLRLSEFRSGKAKQAG
jgi:hypothetical protein